MWIYSPMTPMAEFSRPSTVSLNDVHEWLDVGQLVTVSHRLPVHPETVFLVCLKTNLVYTFVAFKLNGGEFHKKKEITNT